MNPVALPEKMLYSTVLIETQNSRGTGFFFNFKINDITVIPVIITNKHVVNNNTNQDVFMTFHIKRNDSNDETNVRCFVNAEWIFHDNQDLCFCFFEPLCQQIEKIHGIRPFYISIEENLIFDDEKLKFLSAVEDVMMVGYSIGLYDEKNNYPIFRRGITSSHPAIDFNNKNIGLVDMACFPGSSGSPIFIYNENGYTDKNGTTYLGGKRLIFLGVMFSIPVYNAEGNLEVIEIPGSQTIKVNTQIMTNLGYYIKAEEIFALKEKALKIYENQKTNE